MTKEILFDLDDMLPHDLESAILSRKPPVIREHREYGRTKGIPTGLMFVHDYPPYSNNEQSD